MYVQDDKASALSGMMKRKIICNGEVHGHKCVHYFSFAAKTDALNKEFLNYGEKFRNCLVCPGYLIEFDGVESLPHSCDQYVPDCSLVKKALIKIKKVFWSDRVYDSKFEEYNPMSKDDVDNLTREAHGGLLPSNTGLNPTQDMSNTGAPGMTAPMTEDQLRSMVEKLEIVNTDGDKKKTIEEVMQEMKDSGFETSDPAKEEQGKSTVIPASINPDGVTIKGTSKKTTFGEKNNENQDSGIFGSEGDSDD